MFICVIKYLLHQIDKESKKNIYQNLKKKLSIADVDIRFRNFLLQMSTSTIQFFSKIFLIF